MITLLLNLILMSNLDIINLSNKKSDSNASIIIVDKKIKNLFKSKKPDFLKVEIKKILVKSNKPDFAKTYFSKTDFLIFKARFIFIYL